MIFFIELSVLVPFSHSNNVKYEPSDNKPLIVYETELKINSLASNIAYYYSQNGILKRIYSFGVDDHFSVQGSIDEILKDEGLDMESFYQKVKEIIDEKREN